ncbi:MAG: hypothetical protein HY259_03040 [Chloroflexi bacterium]|nr:hypothetical protein [Chloroflexota bacterium]MBI3732418.1 hypothetical protein [Chloroflexota bacterium]
MTSQSILDDLRRVLAYPRIRKYHQFSDEEVALLVDALALATYLTPAHLELHAVQYDST